MSQETEFFLVACTHLLTCRQVGMAMGPVPWTAVYQYCVAVGYDDWEAMMTIVSLVDVGLEKARAKDDEQ